MKRTRQYIAAALMACSVIGLQPSAALANEALYQPITYDRVEETITLTGHDMTIEQVVLIARHGAKVKLSPEARQRSADAFGLLLQGAAEGMPIYWFNRGAGSQREVSIFEGSPMEPENKALLEARQLARFEAGATGAYGPEIADEAVVRAMMAIRANTMSYEAASPDLTDALVNLINAGITPVVNSRGTLGEGDLAILGHIGAAMVGSGEVYYKGSRMPASEALKKAGLKPLQPFGADDAALVSTNAYAIARSALLVADAKQLLDWTDVSYAMALNGMNSSVTPISMPVQSNRPFEWLNWDAERVLKMLRGSYLLEDDPQRIIQDPLSLRASSQRQGSAWEAWSRLRDATLISMNVSDHNPAVRPGLTPDSSWELSSPHMMKFYVEGGELSGGKSGYIFSNANWDPYPLANDIEAFTLALANMGVAVVLRIDRFSNPFFTVVSPGEVLDMSQEEMWSAPSGGGYLPVDLWQEMSTYMVPLTPQGQAIVSTVEDLEANTRLKLDHATSAVDVGMHLVAQDLMMNAFWMDVRKAQDPSRLFGPAPTAAHAALRKVVPLKAPDGQRPTQPYGQTVYEFMKATPASQFIVENPPMPSGKSVPVVGE